MIIKKILFLIITFTFLNPIKNIQEEDPKFIFEEAIQNLSLSDYNSATINLKKLDDINYCNKDAIELMLGYSLAMDIKRNRALSYIEALENTTFSNDMQKFIKTLESFIKNEGPVLTESQNQKLLDYINPPLSGQSQHLNDREKERFLIQREYVRRFFENGLEALQVTLSDTSGNIDDGTSDPVWEGEVTYPSQEELDYSSSSYWERAYNGSSATEISIEDQSGYFDYRDYTTSTSNGIIDELKEVFKDC